MKYNEFDESKHRASEVRESELVVENPHGLDNETVASLAQSPIRAAAVALILLVFGYSQVQAQIYSREFSIDPVSPEVPPASAADVITAVWPIPPGFLRSGFAASGLVAADNIDAWSTGLSDLTTFPPPITNQLVVQFSVDRASIGAAAAVTAEVAGDGTAADIFMLLCPQGAGACNQPAWFINSSPPAPVNFGLTAVPPAPGSDVDAWEYLHPLGLPPGIFSLDPASAMANGVAPADLLIQTAAGFAMYAPLAALGLVPGDDIDAISVGEQSGSPVLFDNADFVYFSLAPGSPTLGAFASAADIFLVQAGGGGPAIWATAAGLGLLPGDNIDALQVYDPGVVVGGGAGDLDGDGDVDLIDFTAFAACANGPGNLPAVGCSVAADFDADGDVDLIDFAALAGNFTGPF